MPKKHPPPAPSAPPELLATLDLASILRVSPRQVLNMHSRGQLPRGHKVPGLGLRWVRSELDEWLKERVGK